MRIWITTAGLALYLAGIIYTIVTISRKKDPQAGSAIGCLLIFAAPAIALAAILIIGVLSHREFLVRFAFYVTIFPLGYLLLQCAGTTIFKWRKRLRR
jgi:hypothetical protein